MDGTLRSLLALFIFAVLLASCSTVTPPAAPATKLPWADREAALNRIQSWHVNGKIAVQTAKDSGSATIDWTQTRGQYRVSIYGPLGSNSIKLSGRPGAVVLQTSDGKSYRATSPEELLSKRWGFNLPVSYLNYWIRGLPVPEIPSNTRFDNFGRLANLSQDGWNIQFQDYTRSGGVDLPSRIGITSPSLRVKIVIYEWKVG